MKCDRYYVYWSIFLFLVELYIGFFVRDNFIRPYVGDFLVVILIYALMRTYSKFSTVPTAMGVLLFSFGVELMQYFNIVNWLGLGNSQLARIVIGTSFDWKDCVAYSLGIITVLLSEALISPSLKKML